MISHAGVARHCRARRSGRVSQLSALARMRALVVLPTPRTPVNRNACATRPLAIALLSVRVTCSWPTRSENVCGPILPREDRVAHGRVRL